MEKLKAKIIKANPSIMDLVFGCEVENEVGKKLRLTGEPFNTGGTFSSDFVPIATIDNPFLSTFKEDYKILGKPITLSNVLITYFKQNHFDEYENRIFLEVVDNGMFKGEAYNWEEEPVFWNLKENLDGQSKLTIKFLEDLLT